MDPHHPLLRSLLLFELALAGATTAGLLARGLRRRAWPSRWIEPLVPAAIALLWAAAAVGAALWPGAGTGAGADYPYSKPDW